LDIPGFSAFLSDGTLNEQSEPHAEIVLNIGSSLVAIEEKSIDKKHMPYLIMEDIIHELTHVLEEWCGVEFNEEKVEALLEKYRQHYRNNGDMGEDDPEGNCL